MSIGFIAISETPPGDPHLRVLTVKSGALRARADITVFAPPGADTITDVPLVLLLHGVYGSHWNWTLNGQVHRTALRMIESGEILQLRPVI